MDIGLNESQLALRDSVRSVLAAESPPSVTREAYDDPERWRALWKTVVDLGWPALALGDEASGLGVVELVAVLEECGAATAPVPMLSSIGHAAGALRAGGATGAGFLQELADGAVGTLLADRQDARLPGPVLALADGRVRGVAHDVPNVDRADLLVALAADDAGASYVTVLRPGAGVDLEPREAVDPSQPIADIHVDAVPHLCTPVDLRAALCVPLVASAAELVGVADRALATSVQHAKTRRQFDRPIGAFQGVKHRLANAYVALERARSLTYLSAARCAAGLPPDAVTWRAALLAKAAAGDAAAESTRTSVAVHGAIAQTWEHDLHLLLRRAWQGGALMGESSALYVEAARDFVAEPGG